MHKYLFSILILTISKMNSATDWTYDPLNFVNLPKIIEDLHNHDQYYINIIVNRIFCSFLKNNKYFNWYQLVSIVEKGSCYKYKTWLLAV